jgi:uncharacterized protein (TIGR03435 family)
MAWKLNPDNVQGGNAHALDTYYDLSAVAPGTQPWTQDTIPPLLRKLLTDRFHLAAHPGTKQVSGYGLFVAKGGPKLKAADVSAAQQGQKAGEPFQNSIFPGYIRSRGADLRTIASMLSAPLHATVVDRTGIAGVYNLDLHYAPDSTTDSSLPDLFTAVEEQIGLKLNPEKVTVDTLIIDHTDPEPTPD